MGRDGLPLLDRISLYLLGRRLVLSKEKDFHSLAVQQTLAPHMQATPQRDSYQLTTFE